MLQRTLSFLAGSLIAVSGLWSIMFCFFGEVTLLVAIIGICVSEALRFWRFSVWNKRSEVYRLIIRIMIRDAVGGLTWRITASAIQISRKGRHSRIEWNFAALKWSPESRMTGAGCTTRIGYHTEIESFGLFPPEKKRENQENEKKPWKPKFWLCRTSSYPEIKQKNSSVEQGQQNRHPCWTVEKAP